MNAEDALQCLLEGNRRYVANKSIDLNESERRRIEVAQGQKPFATILGCVDSRVPPELIFDRGLGDLFVIRTAGQVLDKAVLGSLEFGVAELEIPVLMVLGHERCGVVKAAIDAVEKQTIAEAEIEYLVEALSPAVEQAKSQAGDLWENAVRANIEMLVSRLKQSPILATAVQNGKLKVVGARYDLDCGAVAIIIE